MPDDGVGRREVVGYQIESIRREKRSSKTAKRISRHQLFARLRLQRFYVLSLPTLRALGHVELHRLTLLKALETARLDCREMHENVFAALTANETVALGIVEPLYRSLFRHIDTRVPF